MHTAMDSKCEVTILHFNDVYNVEEKSEEPVGGAARFCSAIKSFKQLNPLVVFSGDIVSPSMLSTLTQGKHMIPVMRHCGVHFSVFGNHEFDCGLENARDFAKETQIPWMMSNVIDNETGRPLGDGSVSHIVEWGGKTFGLIGLVEEEWLGSLTTVNQEELTYMDYVEVGKNLANKLRKQGAEFIIAITHMRMANDLRLLHEVDTIDLILGGHDHHYEVCQEGTRYLINSGTDFRQFSKITLSFDSSGQVNVSVDEVQVTSKFPEDEMLKQDLETFKDTVSGKMEEVLASFSVELDGRFNKIRTQETNLGNWMCDVMLAALNADLLMMNSGSFRSDQIHPVGDFKYRDLFNILPFDHNMVLIVVKGKNIVESLENAVSQYPRLDGRFLQVSGISFAFDPDLPVGQRVDPRFVKVGDEYVNMDEDYAVGVTDYMYLGREGYKMFPGCRVLVDTEDCPTQQTAILNYFSSIKSVTENSRSTHRANLVTLSRRHTLVRALFEDGNSLVATKLRSAMYRNTVISAAAKWRQQAVRREADQGSCSLLKKEDSTSQENKSKSEMIKELELKACQLAPILEQRIVMLTDETRERFLADHANRRLNEGPILN